MKTILHYGLVLLIIAGVAGVGLSLVDRITKEPIQAAQSKRLEEGQKLAFPSAAAFGELKTLEAEGKTISYYEVFDESKNVIGYELLYQVGGYQSQIKVLSGIEPDGKVSVCGFDIGNVNRESMADIVARYDPFAQEGMRAAAEGVPGLLALAQKRGIAIDLARCYSVCDLCRMVNK